jgi:leucyl-tRNA synthetase
MLSDSPPERDLEWTDEGIVGAWRYLNRLWRLVEERRASLAADTSAAAAPAGEAAIALKRLVHRSIAS